MRKFLTILLGLVVLPMTSFSQVKNNLLLLNSSFSHLSNSLEVHLADHAYPSTSTVESLELMDFTAIAESKDVSNGESFCVQIQVTNFTNILGMEFVINYDPAKLQFSEVKNFNLAGLNAAAFGLPGQGVNPPGQIKVSWFDQNVAGVTVADGTAIFEVCLTAISTDQTDNIFFSNAEIIDINETIVPFASTPGVIKVGTGGDGGNSGGTKNLNVGISRVNGIQGQEVCVEVQVNGFSDLNSLGFTINYDPSQLTFGSVKNFNLSGLNASDFVLPGSGGTAGQIQLNWSSASGVTVGDGTRIFEICFTPTASSGRADININGATASDAANSTINFSSTSGRITISDGGGGGGNGFTVNISNGTVNQGQEVCLNVSVSDFQDILGMEFIINYDPNLLDFSTVKNFNLSGLNEAAFGLPGVGANPAGQIKVSWFDQNVAGVTVANGTVIFELCLTAKVASGTANITMSQAEIINTNEEIVPFNANNGRVVIGDGSGGGGGSGSFEISVSDADVQTNQAFCLDVDVAGFSNIVGMEFTIDYDPALMDFNEVRNFNLKDLNESAFGLPGVGANPLGSIKLSWFDQAASGVSVSDNTTIFQACFTSKSTNASTQVGFQANSLEIIDGNDQQISATGNSGTVNIGQGGGDGDLTLEIGNGNVNSGEVICVPLRVRNFQNLLGMEFLINFDPSVLEFVEVKDFNLAGLNEAAFGAPGVGANPNNQIKLSWFDQNVAGVSVADGTAIFNLCFRALGSNGTNTVVSINNSGIELIDINEQIIPSNRQSGTISIGTVTPGNDLTISFSEESAGNGQEACVNVSVENFANILGMEFTVEYNPALLQFKSVQNFNLDQLTDASFGKPGEGQNPPGKLKLSWLDQNIQGVTVADGTTIFDVCFTVVGNSGSSDVSLDQQSSIEIIDINEQTLPYQVVSGSVTIGSGNSLSIASPATVTNVDCFGESTGSIDIEVLGGSGSFSYQWNYEGRTTQDLDNLPAGNYRVTITDLNNNQTTTGSFQVQGPDRALGINQIRVTDVSCGGTADGALNVQVIGGATPYSFSWSQSIPNTGTPTGLSSGAYMVTVTDANGCVVESEEVTIAKAESDLVIASDITNADCSGANNGAISVSINGGTAPFNYNWNGSLQDGRATQDDLGAGQYRLTVTDANGCEANEMFVVENEGGIMVTDLRVTSIETGADGAVRPILGNNTADPITYSWSGPGGFTSTARRLSGLSETGEYCLTVTDGNGCSSQACATVPGKLGFGEVNITNTCPGESTGRIDLVVRGGVAPYSFEWSDGNKGRTNNNLAAGSYSVTVTDDNGETFNGTFPVRENAAIRIRGNVTQVSGGNNARNGGISLNVSGGNPGYTYRWNTGDRTADLTDIGTGEYCVTVTDQNGCSATECFNVTAQSVALAFTLETTGIDCIGDDNGTLSLQINGGLPPYAVNFSDDVAISSNNGNVNRNNLPGGDVAFVITDAANNTVQGIATVDQPDPIALSGFQVVHDTELPGCIGSITIDLTGGTPGYTVSWNSPNAGTQIIGLCEGDYVPTVRDANGCEQTLPAIEISTFGIAAQVTNTTCAGENNGTAVVNISGGDGPYVYEWRNSQGQVISTEDTLTGAAEGTYTVFVTEQSGNTLQREFKIEAGSSLAATVEVISDYDGFAVSCFDASDGIVSVTAANGANDSYMYEWMLGDEIVGTDSLLQGALPGSYRVVVTDESGCAVERSFTLSAPRAINVSGFVTNVSCPGERDGEIIVTASGGAGIGTFSYNWSNQQTTPRVNFLLEGSYTVTVTDGNNCTGIASFNVNEPDPIQVNVETTPATDGCNGSAKAVVNGGSGPFLYKWNVTTQSDSVLSGLCPGDYALVVSDSRGCTSEPEITMAEVLDRRFPCMDIREVISPDGDGLNETFLINCIEDLNNNRVRIFNRWGQLVFEQENYDNNWRGITSDGELLPDGAYYYVLEFTDNEGNLVQQKGSISLLRE